MFWTEWLLSKFPYYDKGLKVQTFVRLSFLLVIWLLGLMISLSYGTATRYLSNYQIFLPFFGTGIIVLLGAYALQPELKRSYIAFRPQLDMDDAEYAEFTSGLGKYCFSLVPILIIAVVMFILISGGMNLFLTNSLSLELAWGYAIVFIIDLLTGTGIWLGASIWLTIFLISREPLKVDLSHDVINKFRKLTTLALWFSLFYFIALSIGLVIPLSFNPSLFLGSLFYPMMAFILVGVFGILLPFYNIHNALLSMKKRELNNIEAEFEMLQTQFNASLSNDLGAQADYTPPLMRKFFSLQLRERQTKLAQEWPIDIAFVSKLLLLVLIPVIVRIITWIVMGLT